MTAHQGVDEQIRRGLKAVALLALTPIGPPAGKALGRGAWQDNKGEFRVEVAKP